MGTDRELAIIFADVVGSTQLYESLGDDGARETVHKCVDCMKEATADHDGEVIKTMGDEVMSTFASADNAMHAASQMQQKITSGNFSGRDDIRVSIRIGCHYGHVVVEQRDIFGAAVHTANRMTSQAKAGQIITTASTVELLNEDWQSVVRQIGVATLRGQSDEVALYEVLWQPEEATSVLPKIDWGDTQSKNPGQIVLKFQGNEMKLSSEGTRSVTLGRADDNDVTIKGNLISRIHARIELNKTRFMLVDESTNGTFVQRDDGEEVYIRRDSAQLSGSGLIGLGRVAARGTPLAVEYTHEEES
ncbi:MAG: adenylate/guanylate cyclase domain-containing protein [Chromatiales bacterium]|jgi:class 3 adenylate cyclase|nr:adenylate/guanylate cyclase domain-containing protein [Chromatiales bacterium]MDP6150072.1 adenylate/guanylate cyclase domain-containing protein [Gammaproteobacteria bacterium]MDP7270622.1 adenylate/guanylate cyclase domain-containing protein [Gammaproteobacteria bacterium]HJP03730.1 adenylate/guanylate cyclase domain-containing protein [Gammaproteobacteria bacterium]